MIFLFSKAPSFLFFIKMKQGWVGEIFFHHKFIASVNITSDVVIRDLVLCSTHLVSWLEFQHGICMLIKVARYPAMFLCFQSKLSSKDEIKYYDVMIHPLVSNTHHLWQLSSKDNPTHDYILLNDYCYNQVIKQECDM